MRLYTKPRPAPVFSEKMADLMQAKPVWNGATVEFSVEKSVEFDGLTVEEIKALRAAHKTSLPNLQRALDVKRLIQKGFNRAQVVAMLKHKGTGYGSRMVCGYFATLSREARKAKK